MDLLMNKADQILKESRCKCRRDTVHSIKHKCHPNVRFENKNFYIEEKIEDLQREFRFSDIMVDAKKTKREEIQHYKK